TSLLTAKAAAAAAAAAAVALGGVAAAAYTGTLPTPAQQFAHSVIGAPSPQPSHRPGTPQPSYGPGTPQATPARTDAVGPDAAGPPPRPPPTRPAGPPPRPPRTRPSRLAAPRGSASRRDARRGGMARRAAHPTSRQPAAPSQNRGDRHRTEPAAAPGGGRDDRP